MKRSRGMATLLAAVLAVMLSAPAFADSIVYTQSFDETGIANSSQNDAGGLGVFAQVYDNFTLSVDSNVNEVQLTGVYFNPPQRGNLQGWNVQLYADDNGQPGMLLMAKTINNNGNETFLGNFGGVPAYSYGLPDLGFMAAGNTQYWLSVYPDLPFPPQWAWATSAEGDGIGYQDFFGTRQQIGDSAFTLMGAPVPEPGTLVLLGTGLLGLAGTVRRKLV